MKTDKRILSLASLCLLAHTNTSTLLTEIGQSITMHPSEKTNLVHTIISLRFKFLIIKVLPKKTFVELVEKKNDIKITSNISI